MRKTVESMLQGQPDKVCDQIADAIVDEYLRRDKEAHVDVNVMGSHGMLMIGGEVSSTADFDVGAIAKKVYTDIGYTDDIEVFVNIEDQSTEMKRSPHGVQDTVVVNGYATNETRERLPRPLVFAHNLARRIDDLRKTDPAFSWLRPDGKIQLIMEKDQVHAVTILVSHDKNMKEKDVKTALLERVVVPILGEGIQIYINPIGSFTDVCFRADSGVSGHKTHVDLYGGLIPHGDGGLSGKDPMRVERAGSYMARLAARSLIEQGLVSAALVNVVYTLGRIDPIHVHVVGMGEKSRGTKTSGGAGSGFAGDLTHTINRQFDFRPEAIVERLDLLKPIYQPTAVYGHVGREEFPWERPL
ncbi:MAG: methionine adenosyltransferase domain-containing protein [Patescibacteria group bacterium]